MEYFEREMSDHELLELALKAAELVKLDVKMGDIFVYDRYGFSSLWNPLTDAAAAMHLAVKLEMLVDTMDGRVIAGGTNSPEVVIDFKIDEDDPYAATRRAIVMAAAVVGKGMK